MSQKIEVTGAKSGQIAFAGLLTLIFITLKLTHVIAWSWWWVLAPLWIGVALAGGCLLLVMLFALLMAAACSPPAQQPTVGRTGFSRGFGNQPIEIVDDSVRNATCYIYPGYGISCARGTVR